MPDETNTNGARASRAVSGTPVPKKRGKRRRVAAGDLAALRRELWFAVRRTSALLDDPDAAPELVIKAANALALLGNAYARLVEATELEAAVEAIRRDVEDIKRQRTGYPSGFRTA